MISAISISTITKSLIQRYKNSNGVMVNEFYVERKGKTFHVRVFEHPHDCYWAYYVSDLENDLEFPDYGYGRSVDAAIENLFEE